MMITETMWESASISQRCCVFANLAFWAASALNVWVDHMSQTKTLPRFLSKLKKLQPNMYLSRSELWDVVVLSGFNMLFVAPVICCRLFEFSWNLLHRQDRLQPSEEWHWRREVVLLPAFMFLTEMGFYGAHWILHQWFYQSIHKVHHRFKAPCAMTASYAHPLEFVFGNVLPIALGPILLNAHPYSAYFWFFAAMLSTCKGHSGYDFMNAATHDAHHQHTKYNYGVLHIADLVMGTTYKPSKQQ